MTYSKELINYTHNAWVLRRGELGELLTEAERVLSRCNDEEKLLLQYVMATLPLSDLGDYRPHLFLSFVRHALRVRKEFSWCGELPEHMFLKEVLYPRINTEELADCRELFYNELAPRVKGLTLEEAILEVNCWCAEEVTYRTTDDRTASPLAVYLCGYGRCGEESTFAVTAMRSVGIAARQVYAPWWSHCDDNHAWVEAFDSNRWRYLGACEPEPELDRGWFTGAASRAMLIHARYFVSGTAAQTAFLFPDTDPVDISLRQGVVFESVTANYGKTAPVEITVSTEDGAVVKDAGVSLSILNMSQLSEIAAGNTDDNGVLRLSLGYGSVWVTAWKNGLWAQGLYNTEEEDCLRLVLKGQNVEDTRADGIPFDFYAPKDPQNYPEPLTTLQKRERRERLNSCAAMREQKMAEKAGADSSRGDNLRILQTMTEKDVATEIRPEIISESEWAYAWESCCRPEVFSEALLSPRIHLEPLMPWRAQLSRAFPESERQAFREAPQRIWEWVVRNVREGREIYPQLPGTPLGIFKLRACNKYGRPVLFCAICRSLGIPARLSPTDNTPEYYERGGFRPVTAVGGGAQIKLISPESQQGLFRQNYTISRFVDGVGYVTVTTPDIPKGEVAEISLLPGRYRLITVNRMPGGNQLAKRRDFTLMQGDKKEILLSFRKGSAADMLEHQPLPAFTLENGEKEVISCEDLLAQSSYSLIIWLEVSREPTEHILNELRENGEKFRELKDICNVHLILERPIDRDDATLCRALKELPDVRIWYGDGEDTVQLLARRMYVDPERLPLIILGDQEGNGLYACSGYNVGTAELLLRLVAESGR